MIEEIIFAIGFIILAPFIGALIGGLDRKVTARMQGRVGPPVLQPLYDVFKLFEKEKAVVRNEVNFYIFSYLIFVVLTGALFFSGGDILLVIFALTLAHAFLILGAYASVSPYSHVGAERELLQLMAVEPMLILAAAGFYMATGSFAVKDIAFWPEPIVMTFPLIFVGIVYVLTIKLRKSPFDLATTHHAHQELVKGLTTEFAGVRSGDFFVSSMTRGPVQKSDMKVPSFPDPTPYDGATGWWATWTKETLQDYRRFSPLHGGDANILFADGSVRSVKDKDRDGLLNNGFPKGVGGFESDEIELPAAEFMSRFSLRAKDLE